MVAADVLSITSGTNGVAGSSLSVKLSGLIDVADDAISMDLLSKGNYTLSSRSCLWHRAV